LTETAPESQPSSDSPGGRGGSTPPQLALIEQLAESLVTGDLAMMQAASLPRLFANWRGESFAVLHADHAGWDRATPRHSAAEMERGAALLQERIVDAGLSVKHALAVWPTLSARDEVVLEEQARRRFGSQPVFIVFRISKDSARRLSQGSDAARFLYLGPETGHTLKCIRVEGDGASGQPDERDWPQVCGWPIHPSQRSGGADASPVGMITVAERAVFAAHLAAGGCAFYYSAASMYEAVFFQRAIDAWRAR
jgi:hypothetical protein